MGDVHQEHRENEGGSTNRPIELNIQFDEVCIFNGGESVGI